MGRFENIVSIKLDVNSQDEPQNLIRLDLKVDMPMARVFEQ